MKPMQVARCLETSLTHAGRAPAKYHGFVNPPVYRGSTVLALTVDDLLNYRQPFVYGRLGSPTTAALQDAVRELDGSAGVLLCLWTRTVVFLAIWIKSIR
ncbi:PLP-dependent transferase [Erwiniaceae bacterium CAU 1747]